MATKASNIAQAARTVDASGNVDGDTLDNLDSSQFLRSDTDDTMTGNLDVQGTVTADGLTVFNDNGASNSYDFKSDHYCQIQLTSDVDGTNLGPYTQQLVGNGNTGSFELRTDNTKRIIVEQNGNISFNDNTGENAKFFWDASSEYLGIGNSSPQSRLDITGVGGGSAVTFKTTDSSLNETFYIVDGGRVGVRYPSFTVGIPRTTSSATNAIFQVEEAGYLTVLNNGNVGIGTSNPGAPLDFGVTSTGQQVIKLRRNNNSTTGLSITSDYGVRVFGPSDALSTGNLFEVGEMDISDGTSFLGSLFNVQYDGKVGIGTSSPSVTLDVGSKTDAIALPRGTTAQRPGSPANGYIRYNTDEDCIEEYRGGSWQILSNLFSASGGDNVYTSGGYRYHEFTSSGNFTVLAGQTTVDYLIVAGGGGGGGEHGGGGGAGGYIASTASVNVNSYTIIVGAGGAGSVSSRPGQYGGDGGDSSAFGSTAIGGGAGGYRYNNGRSGGSGGGAGPDANIGAGGAGTSGQGFAGGASTGTGDPYQGAGGGGASEVGVSAQSGTSVQTNGGDGKQWLNGSTYAGGGGGGVAYSGTALYGSGGAGGGGRGALTNALAESGSANTGGGGGGANRYAPNANHSSSSIGPAGAGGSGIVIIRYPI